MTGHGHGEQDACRHERGHITDSRFFGNRYATPGSRQIFCDVCRKQRWLEIERALARAEGELGLIPQEMAERISSTTLHPAELDAVRDEIEASGHSLVGLLRVFERACGPEAGQFIHYGATTQDIQDTAQSLEMRDVLDLLEPLLRAVVLRLATLAEETADVVALGRTHAQPALPIGFGLKPASWIDELLRHCERIDQMRDRVLVAQLFGGAGTMAAFGDRGTELLERFACEVGLDAPVIGWHVARDRMVEFVSTLAMITGTLGRIADEIRLLSRPEFGEVVESWMPGKVGSSTMPHKRNPERCEQVVVMAKLAAVQVGAALAGMIGDHERDSRALRVEWACLPDSAHYCTAAAAMLLETVTGLTVDSGRLRANVDAVTGQIMSERLMLALGRQLGKQRAHEVVYQLSQRTYQEDVTIQQLLRDRPDLLAVLAPETLEDIFDPASYLGASAELTMRAVAEAHKRLGVVAGTVTGAE